MSLTPPYWLQKSPRRGNAPELDLLAPKHDIYVHSSSHLDIIIGLWMLDGDGKPTTTPESIDGDEAEMGFWREEGDGSLQLIETLTTGNGRLIVGSGQIRIITEPGVYVSAAYPATSYYALALTDAIPRTRIKLAGQFVLVDRLRTAKQ